MYDMITIGSASRDVFLLSREFKLIPMRGVPGGVAECVTLGAKIDVDELVLTTGGGATNAAATFAGLGLSTAVIAKVGDDEPGHAVLADLESRGIATNLVTTVKHGKTAYSTLLTANNGERTALVFRGVSSSFTERDVPLPKCKTRGIYLTSLAGDTALAMKIGAYAHKKNIAIAWNPGGAELAAGRGLLAITRLMSVVLMNREEACLLLGRKDEDLRALAKSIAQEEQIIVITDGPNGALAYRNGQAWMSRTTGKPSVSRTGAGDAFGSGFVAALMRDLSVPDALRLATHNAESVIQHVGAKAGILTAWPKAAALADIRVREL